LISRKEVTRHRGVALDTELRSTTSAGNNSTSQGYQVTFPFLEPSHIRVQLLPAVGPPVLLGESAYTVHTPAGQAAYITTTAPVSPSVTVQIFRWLPYLQPMVIPEGGKLPSAALERALDRAVMLAMQSNPDGGYNVPSDGVRDVAVWADAPARGALLPSRAGQLGVQLGDDTIWIAQSTAAGDWASFSPTPPTPDARLCLAYIADAGIPGAAQTAVANTLSSFGAEYVLMGGDNNYDIGGNPAAYTAFQPWIATGKALAVRGNHDLASAAVIAAHATAFPSLNTGGQPWWSRVLGNGLVEIFGIETGRKSDLTFISGGYQIEGGAQQLWLEAALKASTARHKLVMMHVAPVSTVDDPARVCAEMDWACLARADAILCGHTHLSEWLIWRGLPVINFSGAVLTNGVSATRPVPVEMATVPIYINDIDPLVARLWVTANDIMVEGVNTGTGAIEFSRSIYDRSPRSFTRAVWLVLPGEDIFPVAGPSFIDFGVFGPCRINAVTVNHGRSNGTAGGTLSLLLDDEPITYSAIPMGQDTRVSGDGITKRWVPVGSRLVASLFLDGGYSGVSAKGLCVTLTGDSFE
jgi:Calcineurin-like phosphoesterase